MFEPAILSFVGGCNCTLDLWEASLTNYRDIRYPRIGACRNSFELVASFSNVPVLLPSGPSLGNESQRSQRNANIPKTIRGLTVIESASELCGYSHVHAWRHCCINDAAVPGYKSLAMFLA